MFYPVHGLEIRSRYRIMLPLEMELIRKSLGKWHAVVAASNF